MDKCMSQYMNAAKHGNVYQQYAASYYYRYLLCILSLVLLGILSACQDMSSVWQQKTYTVHISQNKIQEKIATRFPMHRQIMGVASVHISQPQLRLMPDTNRIGTTLQIHIPPVLGLTPDLSGDIRLSYGLRYDAAAYAVRLNELVVESVQMRDKQGNSNVWLNAALSALGAQVLQDIGLYQLKPSDITKMQASGFYPTQIRVTEKGLDILLERKSDAHHNGAG